MVDSKRKEAAKAAFSFIKASLAEPGFPKPDAWRFLDAATLRQACASLSPESRARLGVDRAGSALVAALAYSEGPTEPAPWVRELAVAFPGPLAALARFARADWYGELLVRLKGLSDRVRSELALAGFEAGGKGDWQRFANSGLPERRLALAAGLGSQGRHGLLIVGPGGGPTQAASGRIGPGVVLGILLMPYALPEEDRAAMGLPCQPADFAADCGSCRACMEACPTGALGWSEGEPSFARERCLQHWAAIPGALPAELEVRWGRRLYGCDSCLEACPHFRPAAAASCDRGVLGPGLPAAWLAGAGDTELTQRFRGTALGLGWMDLGAFRRNARLALFDGRGSNA